MKDNIFMTPAERDYFERIFFPKNFNKNGKRTHSFANIYPKITSRINKRKPPHTRKESWVTFSYTTRWNLVLDWEKKQLRQQQQELFDRLKAEAAKSSDE